MAFRNKHHPIKVSLHIRMLLFTGFDSFDVTENVFVVFSDKVRCVTSRKVKNLSIFTLVNITQYCSADGKSFELTKSPKTFYQSVITT